MAQPRSKAAAIKLAFPVFRPLKGAGTNVLFKTEPKIMHRLSFDVGSLFGESRLTSYDTSDIIVGAQTVQRTAEPGTTDLRLAKIEARLARLETAGPKTTAAFLNTLDDARLELRKPVAVMIEFDEDGYALARWAEALLEGEGNSQLEAIGELRSQIVEAYLDAAAEVAAGFDPDGYPKTLWTLLSEFVVSSEKGRPG